MKAVTDADAIVIKCADRFIEIGNVPIPPLEFLKLRSRLDEGVATTNSLPSVLEMNPQQVKASAGGAYLELGDDGSDYIFFVRKETRTQLRWPRGQAGPQRPPDNQVLEVEDDPFARTTILGESRAFKSSDKDVFRVLRRALYALRQAEVASAAVRAKQAADTDRTKLRAALSDALQANTVGELASTIAHELNQPLAAITNYVGAARKLLESADASVPDPARDAMDSAAEEADRAGALIRRLRGFVEQGDLELAAHDPGAVIQLAVDIAVDLMGVSEEQILVDLEDDLPNIPMDDLQIEQVIVNLLRNAFQAMEYQPERVARVTVSSDETNCIVSVFDKGPGLEADTIETMF